MGTSPDQRRAAQLDALTPVVYDELRRAAEQYIRRQPAGFTLRPTDIVHEAYMHLVQHNNVDWTSTQHFRAIAIRKLWQVVVDHLRRRRARKRGGGGLPAQESPGATTDADGKATPADGTRAAPHPASTAPGGPPAQGADEGWKRIPLDAISVEWRDRTVDLLDLAEGLRDLRGESERLADVVMLHWFGGMTYREVADALGVSASTAEKDFRYALAWLNRRLQDGATHVD